MEETYADMFSDGLESIGDPDGPSLYRVTPDGFELVVDTILPAQVT